MCTHIIAERPLRVRMNAINALDRKKHAERRISKAFTAQERPFKCTSCPKDFKRKAHLARTCKKAFIPQNQKHIHVKIVPKNSLHHSELKRHQRIHTGEATDICPTCKQIFCSCQQYAYPSTYIPSSRKVPCMSRLSQGV